MNIEEDAVDRQDRPKTLEDLGFHRLVKLALNGTARQSARMDERDPFDVARQVVISREKLVAADHHEVGGSAPVWRERARLDVDPADRDPRPRSMAPSRHLPFHSQPRRPRGGTGLCR